jgi:hypothetical protein
VVSAARTRTLTEVPGGSISPQLRVFQSDCGSTEQPSTMPRQKPDGRTTWNRPKPVKSE